MSRNLQEEADYCYQQAEEKATDYFQNLYTELKEKTYVTKLSADFRLWKQNQKRTIFFPKFFYRSQKTPNPYDYHHYIEWLNEMGKLDAYLERSISYIFMRDLGKPIQTPETKKRVRQVVDGLKRNLTKPDDRFGTNQNDLLSITWLYRWGQQEGIEATIIWLMKKLKSVTEHFPVEWDAAEAKRKLIKIIAGVVLHELEAMDEKVMADVRAKRLERAIKLGYSYGLTYPFIDDFLDSTILSVPEKRKYADFIRTTIITKTVPELMIDEWSLKNHQLIRFIHSELREAFQYIKSHQKQNTTKKFFEQAYVFFQSQELDRAKNLANSTYSNEELYIPIILKSSSSRLIVRSLLGASEDEGFDIRTFYYGIYNQLADDFADMFSDIQSGSVTPYTYYLKYHHVRSDLLNPFELYWTVLSGLIHNVYASDGKACEILLSRAINGLKRNKERLGEKKFQEVMELLSINMPTFNRMIQKYLRNVDDVDFFDKLLRDHVLANFKNEQKEQETFLQTIKKARSQINSFLPIPVTHRTSNLPEESIVEAANYVLDGNGKRLRPIITWVMGVEEYRLQETAIIPLLKSLEYMHTASLIFDDLPSQDNATTRRGRPTLHQTYNVAVAELTGIYLMQKATAEQASLQQFAADKVLSVIHYSAQTAAEMCRGQAMDLAAKGKVLDINQLNKLSFNKTGLAFEASLIMPALLADVGPEQMEALKTFAYHTGIAFQIKDDLLDVEGIQSELGKPIGQDVENNNSTFVSILGREEAEKTMWEHYCLALEALQNISLRTSFLKQLLNFIVHRNH